MELNKIVVSLYCYAYQSISQSCMVAFSLNEKKKKELKSSWCLWEVFCRISNEEMPMELVNQNHEISVRCQMKTSVPSVFQNTNDELHSLTNPKSFNYEKKI